MIRREFLLLAGVTCVGALFGCSSPNASNGGSQNSQEAAAIYVNGNVYTVDPDNPKAEAFAVDEAGMLMLVGSQADVEALKGSNTQVVDLEGQFVMPAFGEDHCHLVPPSSMEITFAHKDDPNLAKEFVKQVNDAHPENGGKMDYTDCIYATIMDYAKEHPEKEVICGFGYNPGFLTGEEKEVGLRKSRMDELGEDGPAIYIYSFSGHDVAANSKCIKLCGITKDTEQPYGGVIEKDKDGEPLGTFHDAAMCLLNVPVAVEKQVADITDFQKMYNACGIVNVMNVSANGFYPCPMEGAWEMAKNDELTIRLRSASGITFVNTKENLEKAIKDHKDYQSDMFAVNTAKFFVDGQYYTLADWPSKKGYHGTCCWGDEDVFKDAVATMHENGIQCHFHVYCDRAAKLTMDAIEAACEKNPDKDLRHTLAHLMTIEEEDIQRMAKYNCVAAMQPSWFAKDTGEAYDKWVSMLGEKADYMYPFKSMADAGVIFGGGSDFPVSNEYNPLVGIQMGVTRTFTSSSSADDPEHVLWPEQRVALEQMIEAYTINVAKEIFCEDVTGSLEAGKSADFIILSDDLFAIDVMKISQARVEATYARGRKVYDATEDASEGTDK